MRLPSGGLLHIQTTELWARPETRAPLSALLFEKVAGTLGTADTAAELYREVSDDAHMVCFRPFEVAVDPGDGRAPGDLADAEMLCVAVERGIWSPVIGWLDDRRRPALHAIHRLFRARPDSVDALLEEIEADTAVMAQRGCLSFVLSRSLSDPNAFMIRARWLDQTQWQVHQNDPDFKASAARMHTLYDGPSRRNILIPLDRQSATPAGGSREAGADP